ncbi:steroid monooxygenase [Stemphylium lycopersici]|nr:steroid monooxygenase [Stemphylium lycopersici]
MTTLQPDIVADVIVIGGGFGGCYALHKLRGMRYSVKLLEAGSDFGGVWHFNRYPGARVDSEVPLYQLSLPEVSRSYKFLERFPGYVELQQYFAQMTERLDLHKDSIFNVRVTEAKYNSDTQTWRFLTQCGLTAVSRYVVFATGTTNKPYIPDFPGLAKFHRKVIHPAAWPSRLDLKGKKVGLIGQGASGLQILQELAKEDCELSVFVRNPPTAIAMGQRIISSEEAEQSKNHYDALFMYAKNQSPTGYQHNVCKKSFYETPFEERRQSYEDLWARGGYALLTSNYPEISFDKFANAELYQFWAEKVRPRITSATKREIMAPLEQFQWIGAKRPNLEMDYYEMIDRPNVELVSLKQNKIKAFAEKGIITTGSDGERFHELDLVIVATGYDSVTGSLYEMNIHDKHGVKLQDRWKHEIQTWLGMMIPDVPNAFMLYGPQAPSGLANGPPFLEMQVDWLVELLTKTREKQGVIEVSYAAAKVYRDLNLQAYDRSLIRETPSWWNGSNIPGKVIEPLFWVGGLQAWRQQCDEGLENWSRFIV